MIREATSYDIPKLLSIGAQFFELVALDGVSFDRHSVTNTVQHLIDSPDGAVFVDDEVNGCIGGMLYPYWMNANILTGNEMFWWVNPEHRGPLGIKLLCKLEKWAKLKGASMFQMTCLETSEPKRISELYKRRGYVPTERNFVRVL
jgi:hypothetical protein